MDQVTKDNLYNAHCLGESKPDEYFVVYKNIQVLLEKRIKVNYDKEYLCYYNEAGEVTRFSYRDFIKKSFQLANWMLKEGIKKEDRIGTFLHNHYDTVILYYACWSIGAVVVPVNVSEEPERVNYIFANSKAKMVFTLSMFDEKLKNAVKILQAKLYF